VLAAAVVVAQEERGLAYVGLVYSFRFDYSFGLG
jgi:hypothetical protein